MPELESKMSVIESMKQEKISSDELQQFYDSLSNNLQTKCDFTIDYFDTSLGVLCSRENPTSLNFSVAVLHEILCNLKPSHELWDKVKYAAFLLNLATRGIEFGLLYDIYHQVEIEANFKSLSWREKEIKNAFEEKVVEKLEVKVEGSGFVEFEETKTNVNLLFPQYPDISDGYNYNYQDKETYKANLKTTKRKPKADKDVKKKVKKKKTESGKVVTKQEITSEHKETNTNNDIADNIPSDDNMDEDYNFDQDDEEFESDLEDDKNEIKDELLDKGKKIKAGRRRREDWESIPCTICDYQARNNHFLDKHTFEEHESSRLCTQCGYLTISLKDYVAHNQTHLWTCDTCKKKILGLKGYRWHMRKHKNQPDSEKKEVVKVPCDICGVLLQEKSLKHHLLNDHSEDSFKCDMCDFTANSKYKVAVHRKRHFIKTVNCPECNKVVKDLKSHFRRKCGNTKDKERHYCHLCEKSFSLKHGLDRHIKNIHHRITSFHCDMCEYKTYDNYNLKLHVSKNHTKEDMEKICIYCNQKTGSLEHHIKIYHYEEQMKANNISSAVTKVEENKANMIILNSDVVQIKAQN